MVKNGKPLKKLIFYSIVAIALILVLCFQNSTSRTSKLSGHIPAQRQFTISKPILFSAEKPKEVPVQTPQTPSEGVLGLEADCMSWITKAGVSDTTNAYTLIMRESGCNPRAVNKSSGACGIPQALPCSKLGTNDPIEQIKWMERYVISRYSNWTNAIQFHNSHNWY